MQEPNYPPPEPPPPYFDERGPGPDRNSNRGDRAPGRSISRVPPHDIDAERAVLGSVMIDNEAAYTALEDLEPDDFYHPSHRTVFGAMVELTTKNQPVDAVTLSAHLRGSGALDQVGGIGLLAELGEAVPTAANIKHYAEIVAKKSRARKLIRACTESVELAFSSTNPDDAVDEAEKKIFDISKDKAKKGLVPVSQIVVDTFKEIEKLAEKKEAITGVSTGIHELDLKTAGLQPSDLVIVAGRPSMGKTAFALGIGLHAATHDHRRLAVFSLEMSRESLVKRMLCSDGRIDSARMRGGFLTEEDWPKLGRAAGRLSEAGIYIDDTGSVSVMEVRAKCRRLSAEAGLDLVIIDYLQLMRGSPNAQSREQEISEISRGLKSLAKELAIPVVALSQLNRSVEQRVDKRPGLSDLRESGAIEQDADVIMFVYRDEAYHPDTEDKGIAEIIIGKQRNGPIGAVRCKFHHEYTRFDNLLQEGG